MLALVLALALFSGATIPHEAELKETVSAHWALLAKNDKFGALKYVLDGCQNNFISRREPIILSWSYVEASAVSDKEARVRIQVEAIVPNATESRKLERLETWVWTGESWKLRVDKVDYEEVLKKLVSGAKKPDKSLQITPSTVKIHFFSSRQLGSLRISNATDQPAKITAITVDEDRFQVVNRPDNVPPGEAVFVRVKYKETEHAKDLKSQLTLHLEQGGVEKLFQVPLVYNYISEADLSFWGVTAEKAQTLTHQDKKKLRPVLGKFTPAQIEEMRKKQAPPAPQP